MSFNLGAFLKKALEPAYEHALKQAETVIDAEFATIEAKIAADPSGDAALGTLKNNLISAIAGMHINPLFSAPLTLLLANFNPDLSKYTGTATEKLEAYRKDLDYHISAAHL